MLGLESFNASRNSSKGLSYLPHLLFSIMLIELIVAIILTVVIGTVIAGVIVAITMPFIGAMVRWRANYNPKAVELDGEGDGKSS